MQDVEIRRVRADEAEAYATLRREMLADAPLSFASAPEQDGASDPAIARERLASGDAITLGAFTRAGALVGSMTVHREPSRKARHKAWLVAAYVRPSHRRRGLAAALLAQAVREAREMTGVDWLRLSVSATAPAARRLYERAGFVAWGREPDALREGHEAADEIHMALRLADRG